MDVRQIALKLLDEYRGGDTYINLSLSSHLTDGLSAENRSFLTSLLYTVIERKITLDHYIGYLTSRAPSEISNRALDVLRIGLCQILYFDRIPDFAAVNETVKLAGNDGERAFVNGVLRRAVREKETLPLPPREKNVKRYLSVRYSVPQKTVGLFCRVLGDEGAEELLKAFSTRPPLTLRVHTEKIGRDAYLSLLKENGIEAAPTAVSDVGVRVYASVPPRDLPGFSDGLFFVQDEAGQIEGRVLDPRPGQRVVDVCCAPGGKSFDAAIRMGEGEVVSLDLHESKLSLVRDGAARLGLSSVLRVSAHDGEIAREDLVGTADRVICDVPCSGLGVLWKKPDLRYADFSRTEELPKLALSILTASAAYLKDGGVLVYSTCTLNPAENEDVKNAFLRSHPDFTAEPFDVGGKAADGDYTFYPHIDGTDGFYIAKLRKKQG